MQIEKNDFVNDSMVVVGGCLTVDHLGGKGVKSPAESVGVNKLHDCEHVKL
jgi:hypothetical protein